MRGVRRGAGRSKNRTRGLRVVLLIGVAAAVGCEPGVPVATPLSAQRALSREEFAGLVERISEPGGYFDTDNLISNETGYLTVIGGLKRSGLRGGAYVGVGPDQNFSYIATVRPEIAFITDVRRDNLLHHLLLKALIERSPTRIEFLSQLHGVEPPTDPESWRAHEIEELVARIDSIWEPGDPGPALTEAIAGRIAEYGLPLSEEDYDTIRRFHATFTRAGLGLRFTSFGRPPRPYYPTYRQLVLETDLSGARASYLSTAGAYEVVRDLQLANRVVPVVGDLSGSHALREMGAAMRELEVALSLVYASNVEFYLWQAGTFDAWVDNLRTLPTRPDALVVRSYFPNFRRGHPAAVPGYYATQMLQPAATLTRGGFESYWDVVTRDLVDAR